MALDINAIVQAAKAKAAQATTQTTGSAPVAQKTIDIRTVDAESLKTKSGAGNK